MKPVQFFKNLPLGVKFNLSLILSLGVVLVSIGILRNIGMAQLAINLSYNRLEEEAQVMQSRLQERQEQILQGAKTLVYSLRLAEMLAEENPTLELTRVLANAARLGLDEVHLVDAAGHEVIEHDNPNAQNHSEAAAKFLERGLIGAESQGIISLTNGDSQEIALATVIPVKDAAGAILGALLVAQNLDDDFLTALNFEREDIHLGLLHDGTVVARDASKPEEFEVYPAEDQEYINQAQAGEIGLVDHITFSDDSPDAAAYVPLVSQNIVQAILAIRYETAELFFYQAQLTFNIVAVALVVVVVSFIGVTLLVRGSIAEPINHLKTAAAQMAQGDYSQCALVDSQDEIGQLAASFNQMAVAVQARDSELSELNASLEQRVTERTAELRRATAVAQESVRLKSEFMSTMSHELRTPLNAILGYCGIMLGGMGGTLDEEAYKMLERVSANSTRLLNLINEVLDLAKIEAGRMEMVSKPVDLHKLAQEWQAQMKVLAEQKGLVFTVEVDPELPKTVLTDAERVTQIGINLLSNAFKFTESGGVHLSFMKPTDDLWAIEVKDTGIGIPPHAINYIFDEFRQLDGSSKRVYGGTGLGLAIVRNLCLMMGGQVRVTSELGKGSTFTVTLPLVLNSEIAVQTPAAVKN